MGPVLAVLSLAMLWKVSAILGGPANMML